MNAGAEYKHVIGLTGPIASGKGLAARAIADMFEGRENVRNVLLSDYIRKVVRDNGEELTRDTLREAGNALRKERGSGAWVERMLEELPEDESGVLLVDSIRNPGEIEKLRETFGGRVVVVATEAPIEARVQRVLKRAREEDSTETREIIRQMEIELERNPEFGFDLKACKEKADIVSPSRESKREKMREIQAEIRRHFTERGMEIHREMRPPRAA